MGVTVALHAADRGHLWGRVRRFVSIAGGYEMQTKTFKNVSITHYSSDPAHFGEVDVLIYCDHATAEDQNGLKWKYYSGRLFHLIPDKDDKNNLIWDTIPFTSLETLPKEADMGKSIEGIISSGNTDPNKMSFAELRRNIAQESAMGQDTRGKQVDLYGKIALPLASQAAEAAIHADNEDPWAHYALGSVHMLMRRFDDSLAEYAMSLRNSLDATHSRNSSAPLFLITTWGSTYLTSTLPVLPSLASCFAFSIALFEYGLPLSSSTKPCVITWRYGALPCTPIEASSETIIDSAHSSPRSLASLRTRLASSSACCTA